MGGGYFGDLATRPDFTTIGTLSSLVSQMPAGAFIDSLPDKRRAVRLGVVGIGLAALMLALADCLREFIPTGINAAVVREQLTLYSNS